MNRRDFIKTIPLLAVAPLALTDLKGNPNPSGKHLIALGTAASLIISRYGAELSFDSVTLINDCIPEGTEVAADLIPFFPSESVFNRWGEHRYLKREKLPELKLPAEIRNYLNSKSGELVFVAGLGRASGTMLFKAIVQQYTNPLQQLRFVATIPFYFEGSHLTDNADQIVKLLANQSLETSLFHLQDIGKIYGNLSIRSAFKKGDECVVRELNRISLTN